MKKRFLFILIITTIFFTDSFSQSNIIKGKVIDKKTKSPLAFVNIVYNNENHGAISGINGRFSLKSNKPIKFIKLSYIFAFR